MTRQEEKTKENMNGLIKGLTTEQHIITKVLVGYDTANNPMWRYFCNCNTTASLCSEAVEYLSQTKGRLKRTKFQ